MPQQFKNYKAPLTLALVKNLAHPLTGDYVVNDTTLPGFAIRVSKNAKTWIVRKKVGGVTHRPTVGHYPQLTLSEAREKARVALGMLAEGKHPDFEREKVAAETTKQYFENQYTFADVWSEYKASSEFKKSTIYGFEFTETKLKGHQIWSTPFAKITEEIVLDAFKKACVIVSKRAKDGRTTGGNVMRTLRSAASHAIKTKYRDGRANIISIAMNGHWPKMRASKRTVIDQKDSLKKWWNAVEERRTFHKEEHFKESDNTFADFFLIVIFFGGRKTETSKLEWADIDFEMDTVTFREEVTKNGKEHTFPLTPFPKNILLRRFNDKNRHEKYVFQSIKRTRNKETNEFNEISHIIEPSSQIKWLKQKAGFDFSTHDLRRSFTDLMSDNSELDIVKAALNHSPGSVTEKYYRDKLRKLRRHYLEFERHILKEAGIIEHSNIAENVIVVKDVEFTEEELLKALEELREKKRRAVFESA